MNRYIKTLNITIEKDRDREYYIVTEYNKHEKGINTEIVIYHTYEKDLITRDYRDIYCDWDSFLDQTGDFEAPDVEQYEKDCREARELDQAGL